MTVKTTNRSHRVIRRGEKQVVAGRRLPMNGARLIKSVAPVEQAQCHFRQRERRNRSNNRERNTRQPERETGASIALSLFAPINPQFTTLSRAFRFLPDCCS
jgi:hypothetical protein